MPFAFVIADAGLMTVVFHVPTRTTRFPATGVPAAERKVTVTVENALPSALTESREAVTKDFVGEAYGTPPLSGNVHSWATSP